MEDVGSSQVSALTVLAAACDYQTISPTFDRSGELLMTGEGHSDWLSSAEFHPSAARLATGSGDGTVRVWDLVRGKCVFSFPEHRQPVWGCSWHWGGDYIASGGMDHSCKVWDPTR